MAYNKYKFEALNFIEVERAVFYLIPKLFYSRIWVKKEKNIYRQVHFYDDVDISSVDSPVKYKARASLH